MRIICTLDDLLPRSIAAQAKEDPDCIETDQFALAGIPAKVQKTLDEVKGIADNRYYDELTHAELRANIMRHVERWIDSALNERKED